MPRIFILIAVRRADVNVRAIEYSRLNHLKNGRVCYSRVNFIAFTLFSFRSQRREYRVHMSLAIGKNKLTGDVIDIVARATGIGFLLWRVRESLADRKTFTKPIEKTGYNEFSPSIRYARKRKKVFITNCSTNWNIIAHCA